MLPLAELHLHVEGTLEADLLVRLARRNDVPLPTYDPAELTARYDFADLQAFLDVYYANLAVLRTEQDFHDLAAAYLTRPRAAGVRRAEIFCDPQTHLRNGVPLEVGVRRPAARRLPRHARQAVRRPDRVLPARPRRRGGRGAAAAGAAVPRALHRGGAGLRRGRLPAARCSGRRTRSPRAEGLHRVAHAGEEGGPTYVREALDVLGVERIDHGNRALEDADLVARLRDERIR